MALNTNTTGAWNTALGFALPYNTRGANNIAAGYSAMQLNEDGNNNTAYGTLSLLMNITGDNNTAIGFEAGKSTTGDGNVFLGYRAGANANVSNKLYIANSNDATPLIYGDFTSEFVTHYGNTGIGTQNFGDGTRVLAMVNGTVPTSSIVNGVLLYTSGAISSELRVRDEAGNVTTLSPHNFSLVQKSEPMAWSFYSENSETGQTINVDMLRAVRLIEELSGEQLVYIQGIEGKEVISEFSNTGLSGNNNLQNKIEVLEKKNLIYETEIESLKKQIQELKTLILKK
jgi:hypothetical protein